MEKTEKLEWNDSLLVGIPLIDDQHKKLVAIANKLYDIATGPADVFKSKMQEVLKEARDYTLYHFSAEEKFLKEHDYPSIDMHKVAHDAFVSEIDGEIKKINDPTQADAMRLYSYFQNWLFQHIARADHIWADFVRPKLPAAEQGPLPPKA